MVHRRVLIPSTRKQIESITILKDAVSTAMLGMRASNGAILITTKKGKVGTPKIEFACYDGYSATTENAFVFACI
jgi:TonB-dependent SusC/RagA subfamily outer membrane receptor